MKDSMEKIHDKKIIEQIIARSSLYINRGQEAIKELLKDTKKEDLSDLEKERFNQIHVLIATMLDLMHQAMPVAHDIFPEQKDVIDNFFKMHQNFVESKLIHPCSCDYCKKHSKLPVEESQENKKEEEKPQK